MPQFQGSIESGPATNAVAVTPDSGNNLPFGQCRSLYIGVSGDVFLDTPNQTNIRFRNVPIGVLPVAAVRVRATSTATDIVALY